MDYQKIMDIICSSIAAAIDDKADKLPYDRTFPSVIQGPGNKGKYKIRKETGIYEIPNSTGMNLSTGQKVWVTIPSGDLNRMYICGLR